MSGLRVEGLTKKLGDKVVLDEVSFQVPDGEFFVMLGPSGGGKTTLLRLICGLEQPDAGRINLDGRDVTTLPPRERNLAMVFQEYGLYPNMDVAQNIAYGLEARHMPKQEIAERVQHAAQTLGLGEMLKRSIADLSGGEQQRVALARAMAKDASVYLYDEPLSNLDPKLRAHSRQQIKLVHRQKRKASLYITHDQGEALAMANRIGLMADGKLQQVGTPDDLLHEPANLFVARFMGTPPMNLVAGEIGRQDAAYTFQADGVRVSLPGRWGPALERYGKREVVFGVPPDAISANGTAPEGDGITGEVGRVEPLIGETEVGLRLGTGDVIAAVIADTGEAPIEEGTRLHVQVDPERVRLFDPETERALASQPYG